MTAIEGTINGVPFQATLQPDGQKSHWLKVNRKLCEAAGAEIGSTGSPPPSSQRRARAGSKMPARCLLPISVALAASTGLGFTVKA
jgi:hypothetical protein